MDFLFSPEPIAWVQQLFGLGHPNPFRTIDLLATNWGVVLAVALALWLWDREDAYALVAIVAAEAALNLLLNQLFSVSRPSAESIVKYEQVNLGSFPSGHVFTATVLWGLLAARRRIPYWLAALVVAGVGVSRLYLGTHYLADVIGGALLGVALVWLFTLVWPRAREWLSERGAAFWIGAVAVAVAGGIAIAAWMAGDNPFMWKSAGLMVGGSLALLAEYRWIRYRPAGVTAGSAAQKVAVGLTGLIPLLVVDLVTGESALLVGAVMVGIGAAWAFWGAPALFVRLGLEHGREPATSGVRSTGRVVGSSLAALLALLLAYAVAVEPRLILDVESETAQLPGLPAAWEGERIAVLADFQVGMWWDNTGMVERSIRRAIRERPAAIMLLGDFIYHPPAVPHELVAEVARLLRPLADSGIPTFAVLGNHDWGLDVEDGDINRDAARLMREALEELEIPVLHNRAVTLPAPAGSPGESLYLVGIGSSWAGGAAPRRALDGVPAGAPRVVLMHNPEAFEEIPAGAAPLAVAGHTHGGQVRIPFTGSWSWLEIVREGEAHANGWIDPDYGAPGNRLYVNRGIGFSDLPVRLNCPPELTLFTLRRWPAPERAADSAPRAATSRADTERPR